MRRSLLLVLGGLAAAAAACGARTGLVVDGQAGSSSGAGGSSGGTAPVGPLAVKCTSAMQAGAPTPTRGYCPTRAGQAAFAGPKAPVVTWVAQPYSIPDPEHYFPAQVVVDASGQSYVAVNASPANEEQAPNRVTAIDPGGKVLWTNTFPTPVSGLSLGSDGTLWMLGVDVLGLSPAGDVVDDLPLGTDLASPSLSPGAGNYGDVAIGSDGSLFVATGNISQFPTQDSAIERVSAEGAILWRYPWTPGDPLASPFVLTPDDAVVDLATGEVFELDASGADAWQAPVSPGQGVSDGSGNVYVLDVPGEANPSLRVVDAAGVVVHTVSLGLPQLTIDASALAVAGDGTAVVLVAEEVASAASTTAHVVVTAIDPSSGVLWSTPFDATLPFDPAEIDTHYGLFVDSEGTVVVTAGHVTGLDLASGAVLWTLRPPDGQSCLRPVVLGLGGSLIGTQCNGLVFLARDP
jgi:hypothetical protein